MWKIAILLASAFSLAACESNLPNLVLPMEPSAESAAAPRRALTDAEKETISDAVSLAMKDQRPQEFIWAPLVVRINDGAADFCGAVKLPNGFAGKTEYGKYYAKLKFDGTGKVSKVDVMSFAKIKDDNIPTAVDSICMQDGYSVLAVPSTARK